MGNVHMEATQINYRGGSKKMSVEEAIKAAGTEITPEEKAWIDTIPELASQEIIAPEFDAEEGVYAVGDLVIYQGGLYQFTTAHETAGAWNPEEVAAVKISDELDALRSGLTNLTEAVGWDNHYNQWDETWEVGSIDTTTGANVENSTVIRSKGYISITPNTSYYFKSPNVAVAFFYDSNKAYIAQSSANIWEVFTAPANAYYMRFRTSSDYGNTYNNNVSINYPSTITGYYAGHPVIGPAVEELKSGLNNVGACDNLLAIANADTTQYNFINNIAGYRLLLIYTSYYANSPNPVYNSVVLPVALLASIAEYMEFDGIKIAFSYWVNVVQVTDWGTNSHPYVNFVGIK